MQTVEAYYDGNVFIPTMPIRAKKNRTVIVTFLDDETIEPETKKLWNGKADWLEHPIKVDSFTPLSREEANERTHIY